LSAPGVKVIAAVPFPAATLVIVGAFGVVDGLQ
jgi:hypothetical protein